MVRSRLCHVSASACSFMTVFSLQKFGKKYFRTLLLQIKLKIQQFLVITAIEYCCYNRSVVVIKRSWIFQCVIGQKIFIMIGELCDQKANATCTDTFLVFFLRLNNNNFGTNKCLLRFYTLGL